MNAFLHLGAVTSWIAEPSAPGLHSESKGGFALPAAEPGVQFPGSR